MRFPTTRPRHSRWRCQAMLLALLAPTAAWASPPDMPPPAQRADLHAPGMHGPIHDPDGRDVRAAPLPWSQLDATQRQMLAPLQSLWDQLPPQRQQRMASHAERWVQLPPDRQARIREHLVHWAQMTPEQRREAWQGEDAFRSMSPSDRQRVLDAYERFKSLTPEQRRALMQRFRRERDEHRGDPRPPQELSPPAPPPEEQPRQN